MAGVLPSAFVANPTVDASKVLYFEFLAGLMLILLRNAVPKNRTKRKKLRFLSFQAAVLDRPHEYSLTVILHDSIPTIIKASTASLLSDLRQIRQTVSLEVHRAPRPAIYADRRDFESLI